MTIKNTTNTPNKEWLFGNNPSAIENQEKEGQDQLINSSQLPSIEDFSNKDSKEIYEKLGIKVLGLTKNDDLFYDVILPKGWKIKKTEHSMWSELFDDKDNKIGSIFYKAAFYDRNASFNLKME